MQTLKIQKKFWDLIVSGEKQYEFRKASKNYKSGEYEFVSLDEKITYGTALLKEILSTIKVEIDKESQKFVKENYINKGIPYKQYVIIGFLEKQKEKNENN